MGMIIELNKNFPGIKGYLSKQAPGAPPRPGLIWNPQSHRWVKPQEVVSTISDRHQNIIEEAKKAMREISSETSSVEQQERARKLESELSTHESRLWNYYRQAAGTEHEDEFYELHQEAKRWLKDIKTRGHPSPYAKSQV